MASDRSAAVAPPGLAPGETFGDATLALIERLLQDGARHVVALMRHSARQIDVDDRFRAAGSGSQQTLRGGRPAQRTPEKIAHRQADAADQADIEELASRSGPQQG